MEAFVYGFRNRLQRRVEGIAGRFAFLFSLTVGEISMLYYALVASFRESEIPAGARPIYMHGGGYQTGFIAIMCIGVLELIGMHLLLEYLASSLTAWIVTGLSVYGMFFLIADFTALVRRPAMVYEGALYLYIGLRWSGEFDLVDLVGAGPVSFRDEEQADLDLSLLGGGNLRLEFRSEQKIRGLFGPRRQFTTALMTADDPQAVAEYLRGEGGATSDL